MIPGRSIGTRWSVFIWGDKPRIEPMMEVP